MKDLAATLGFLRCAAVFLETGEKNIEKCREFLYNYTVKS